MLRTPEASLTSYKGNSHVLTLRDYLADGLYVDVPVLAYPRRPDINRFIDGKRYAPDMLADRNFLRAFGFNQKEVDYLASHQWREFRLVYFGPYKLENGQDWVWLFRRID